MAEPLAREADHDGPMIQAAQRLEQALVRLEAVFPGQAGEPRPPAAERTDALVVELDAARRRQRELAAAAAAASAALGRAMAGVRVTLEEDAERQGMLDFADPEGDAASDRLEAACETVEETAVDEPPSEEEPAA